MPTSTQVDAILKDDYKEYTDQLNNLCWMLAQIETKRDTVQGRIARHAIHTGRSGGIGARREGVALPAAGRQRHATVPVPVRWQTGRIQLTVQLLEMADGEPGAFVDALESEMNVQKDVMRDVNRQCFGTSDGVIATCGTTSSSTTVQLASNTPLSAMRHLYVGRVVDIGTVASPQTVASNREITAVDFANKTITINGAAVSTTASTHFIFNYNSGGASANTGAQDDGQSELTGLQTHVDDTVVLHTLNPSTTPVWKAQVYANGGTNRPINDTMVDFAIMSNAAESGESINALVSNIGVFTSAKAVLSAYQRNIDEVEFKGGFRGIKWNTPGVSGSGAQELGWMVDHDCPPNRVFGLNMDQFVCHQISEGWKWMDQDGAVLSRVSGELAYEAALYTSMELANKKRNAHFVIEDLTEVSL